MVPRRTHLIAVVTAGLVVFGAACSGGDDDGAGRSTPGPATTVADSDGDVLRDCPPGTDTAGVIPARGAAAAAGLHGTITLAASHPTEGAFASAASIASGYRAYFDLVNGSGGVEVGGRRYAIEVEARNDDGRVARTRENVAAAFGPDGTGAFAAFGLVGTANVAAVQDDLAAWCAPNVFPVTASAAVSDPADPWTVGAPVVLETTEAAAVVAHLAAGRPGARLALLAPLGDDGDRIEAAFRSAVEGTSLSVVAAQRYPAGVDTDVRDEVTALAASGADVLVDAAVLLSCPAAVRVAEEIGWAPLTVAVGPCGSAALLSQAGPAADGALAAAHLMDPGAPEWTDHSRVRAYRQGIESWAEGRNGDTVDPDDPMVVLGWTMGDLFVRALRASELVSRSDVAASLTALSAAEVGLVFDGITLTAGEGDHFYGESARMVRFDAADGSFSPVSDVLAFEGGLAVPPALRAGA
jgi:ABC-type branched-subunit amino acid transport system substrate-binding protein